MAHSLQLGPLSLPGGLVLLAVAAAIALVVGQRMGRRAGVDAEGRLYRILWVGVACARLAFVLQHHGAYLATPWSIIDIRDGGWSAWAGWLGAWLYALWLARRLPAFRKSLLLALALSSATWAAGTALMAWPAREARTLPDFTTLSMVGERVALPSYAGRPTVINLWATWCPPCRREMPVFARAQAEHPDVHFVFLNQGETPAQIQRFLADNKLSLRHVLLDPQGEVARSLGHKGLPTTLFFDADGRLADVRVGELSHPTLMQRVDAIRPGPGRGR